MSLELNLIFNNPEQFVLQAPTGKLKTLDFKNPIAPADLQDIRWYLETYPGEYTTDVDDDLAQRIKGRLSEWGTALFNATLAQFDAQEAFHEFFRNKQPGRVLTIGASHPQILALPWELLHAPNRNFLVHSKPRISIRRQFNASGSLDVADFEPQETVRVLMVVSRPSGAGFIDPRGDALAMLVAIEREGRGKVEMEFLRPATLEALIDRIEDDRQPQIDIIHFDGHGVYDPDGRWFEEAKRSNGLDLTRSTAADAANMGYLLFEDENGDNALISAEKLGSMLQEQEIGLMVLSACQSASVGTAQGDEAGDDEQGAMGSVAARLTHSGIPAVLAMTHSVLVTTTQLLFEKFYGELVRGRGMGEALDNARRHLFMNQKRGLRLRGIEQKEIDLPLDDWFVPVLYQAGADTPLLVESDIALEPDSSSELGWGNLPDVQEAGFWGRSRELWKIDRWFAQKTRRLTVSGFGGQGKTYLALEAGRWLHRTGMFSRVCFIDYSRYQGSAPVSYGVSVLATVLDCNLLDRAAATAELRDRRGAVLLILDNLEALEPEPLRELLDAAKGWSEAGKTRVLLTTRQGSLAIRRRGVSRTGSCGCRGWGARSIRRTRWITWGRYGRCRRRGRSRSRSEGRW